MSVLQEMEQASQEIAQDVAQDMAQLAAVLEPSQDEVAALAAELTAVWRAHEPDARTAALQRVRRRVLGETAALPGLPQFAPQLEALDRIGRPDHVKLWLEIRKFDRKCVHARRLAEVHRQRSQDAAAALAPVFPQRGRVERVLRARATCFLREQRLRTYYGAQAQADAELLRRALA